MSSPVFSFLETDDLALPEIEGLLAQALKMKNHFLKFREFPVSFRKRTVVSLLFFEASTRTRMSFEMAIQRLGGHVSYFDGASKESTSMAKGESYEDTFWTLHSMQPDVMVVRCGGNHLEIKKLREQVSVPLVNAGYGVESHPTQALLDVMTLQESSSNLQNKNILFIGDVAHSRVARSHFKLLPRLGANTGVLGPSIFLQNLPAGTETFTDLKTALQWADVVIGLRVQFERHHSQNVFSREDYISKYQLTKAHASWLKKDALVFHPGPVNWGLEFDSSLREIPQFRMWQQKENGVYMRAALMDLITQKNGAPHA